MVVEGTEGLAGTAHPIQSPPAHQDRRFVLTSYKPVIAGHWIRLATVAGCAFAAGLLEASLLVVVVNTALRVGGGATSDLAGTSGLLGGLDLTVDESLLACIVLAVILMAFQLIGSWVAAQLSAVLIRDVRAGTFTDYAQASWEVQSQRTEADLQDILIRHVNRYAEAVNSITTGTSTLVMILALTISAFIVDPIASIGIVLVGTLLFISIRPLTKIAREFSRAQIVAGRNYAERSLEALGMSQETRTFGVNSKVIELLDSATAAEVTPIRKSLVLRDLVGSAYKLATVLVITLGLWSVYTFIDRGLGALGAIVVILIRALNQLATLQSSYHSLVVQAPFVDRLAQERDYLQRHRQPSGTIRVSAPLDLEFKDVGYSYPSRERALEDVSFHIRYGEAVGIIGPSGSGKSTLVQLMLRLRSPTTGRYLLNGISADEVDDDCWFSQIAFVPQDARLLEGSVRENIVFMRGISDSSDVEGALAKAFLTEDVASLPNGLDTEIGSRRGGLSGGQRQRLAIARALLEEPSILILDEPTSALDMRSEAVVQQTLADLKGTRTLIVIAHRLSTLNLCDRIMVMEGGRLKAFGPREQLERESSFYRDAVALSRLRS